LAVELRVLEKILDESESYEDREEARR